MQTMETSLSVDDIPDEIWLNVFHFCFAKHRFMIENFASSEEGKKPIAPLFQSVGLVSKRMMQTCYKYIRQIPMGFKIDFDRAMYEKPVSPRLFSTIPWLHANRIKLGSFSVCLRGTVEEMQVTKYLLSTCDISDLRELRLCNIRTHQATNEEDDTLSSANKLCTEAGVPLHIMSSKNVVGEADFQAFMAKQVQNMKSLKYMDLSILLHHNWHEPLLNNASKSLIKLRLYIYGDPECNTLAKDRSGATDTRELEIISNAIENMPMLKKIKIVIGSYCRGGLKLRSKSLQRIDVVKWHDGFTVTECTCPLLQHFECTRSFYQSQVSSILHRYLFVDEILWTRKSEARYKVNILTPCVPYTNQELSSFLQRGKIEFKAGIKRFEGVHVPNPCIVKLNLKRKHSTRAA